MAGRKLDEAACCRSGGARRVGGRGRGRPSGLPGPASPGRVPSAARASGLRPLGPRASGLPAPRPCAVARGAGAGASLARWSGRTGLCPDGGNQGARGRCADMPAGRVFTGLLVGRATPSSRGRALRPRPSAARLSAHRASRRPCPPCSRRAGRLSSALRATSDAARRDSLAEAVIRQSSQSVASATGCALSASSDCSSPMRARSSSADSSASPRSRMASAGGAA